jgi:hypothetical protein
MWSVFVQEQTAVGSPLIVIPRSAASSFGFYSTIDSAERGSDFRGRKKKQIPSTATSAGSDSDPDFARSKGMTASKSPSLLGADLHKAVQRF